MSEPRLPESLRRAVSADHRRVRPVAPPGVRLLEAALVGAVLALVTLAGFGVRGDAAALGWALLWGPAALEGLIGAGLIALAAREALPGWSLGRSRLLAALALGVVAQLASALTVWTHGPLLPAEALDGVHGMACAGHEAMLSLPLLACAVFFVTRALPLRPRWSGALAGMGAGILADGIWHLVCPVSNLAHVLVWHVGATVAMTVAGWLLGVGWELGGRRRR